MISSEFLEVLNGTLFVLTVCAVAVFAYYIILRTNEGKWRSRPVAAARAIIAFLIGEAIIRGWVWFWRHQLNDGIEVTWMQHYPVLAIGGAIAAVGLLCVIRIFTPVRGCNWPWIASAALAIAASLFFAIG